MSPPRSMLERAIMGHRFDLAKHLVESGQLAMVKESRKEEVFLEAVRYGQAWLAHQLLQSGVNPNCRDREGTALETAASRGHIRTTEVLLRHGATVEGDGLDPVLAAAHRNYFDVIDLLLRYGAGVNRSNQHGVNPLLMAARSGNIMGVQGLIARGADVNFVGQYGRTPLMNAASSGDVSVAITLLEGGANLQYCSEYGNNALYAAIIEGHCEMVSFLLEQGISTEGVLVKSCLWFFDMPHLTDCVKELLRYGANVNERGGVFDRTPLHGAVQNRRPGVAEVLLLAGADVNACDNTGGTPLMFAAGVRDAECARILLRFGADCTLHDENGLTALQCAKMEDSLEIVQLIKREMLKKGM